MNIATKGYLLSILSFICIVGLTGCVKPIESTSKGNLDGFKHVDISSSNGAEIDGAEETDGIEGVSNLEYSNSFVPYIDIEEIKEETIERQEKYMQILEEQELDETSKALVKSTQKYDREDELKKKKAKMQKAMLAQKSKVTRYASASTTINTPTGFAKNLISAISPWMGTRYVLGGQSHNGIDCSALVQNVYGSMGIRTTRTTYTQVEEGKEVRSLQPGDLIFFDTMAYTATPYDHVGIYIGNNKMVHASTSKGVAEESLNSYYFRNKIVAIRRIIN